MVKLSTTDRAPADTFIEAVPLGTGPPTHEELVAYYPAQFTWDQLRAFLVSGDLRLVRRHLELEKRYHKWCDGIKQEHGSIVNYLLKCRLQWGTCPPFVPSPPPSTPPHTEYFTAHTPASELCIMPNDWPYSVPAAVQHVLVWTRLPILHPALVHARVRARIDQDGLCGFSGTRAPEPTRADLERAMPALEAYGITMGSLVRSAEPTEEERGMVRRARSEVEGFVKRRWVEEEWETAWFVNPPRTQSVPGLAHFHVFAKRKTPEEVIEWRRGSNTV